MTSVLVPVPDEDGGVLLYDIFVEGKWIGSRRTIPQAIDELRRQGWPSSVIATNYEIQRGYDAHRIIFKDAEK